MQNETDIIRWCSLYINVNDDEGEKQILPLIP